jgi:hypothetical protein
MTWEELWNHIGNMEHKFLDTQVEIFDCLEGKTITDIILVKDCSADYVYDVDHPQFWINTENTLTSGEEDA